MCGGHETCGYKTWQSDCFLAYDSGLLANEVDTENNMFTFIYMRMV